MVQRDPYEVLGVPKGAEPEIVKQAYRRLRQQAHPDRNPNDASAASRFREIQAAYRALQQEASETEDPATETGSWSSMFDVIFARPPRATEAVVRVRIPWAVSLDGGVVSVGVRRAVLCPRCSGRGCTGCGPLGHVETTEQQEVRLPPGLADGDRVRVPDARGPGSWVLQVFVSPVEGFSREGNDIHGRLVLPAFRAALGGTHHWPLWKDGGSVDVQVPAGIQHGAVLRLVGRGAAHPLRAERGNLYAHVSVETPRVLSAEQRRILAQWLGDAPPKKRKPRTRKA